MLVLGRMVGQQIFIDTTADGRIVIELADARLGKARIGIEAPANVPVNRAEVAEREIDSVEPRS